MLDVKRKAKKILQKEVPFLVQLSVVVVFIIYVLWLGKFL